MINYLAHLVRHTHLCALGRKKDLQMYSLKKVFLFSVYLGECQGKTNFFLSLKCDFLFFVSFSRMFPRIRMHSGEGLVC